MDHVLLLMLFLAFIFCLTPITVFLHEMGHAIASLVLTKGKIDVYIGSYGETKEGINLYLGRLRIHFKYNIIQWNKGLCHPKSNKISKIKFLFIILAGPLASLILAATCIYFTFKQDLVGELRIVCFGLFFSATIDVLVNLIPSKKPITLFDGSITYNDGHQLKMLLVNLHKTEYNKALNYFNKSDFKNAIPHLKKAINEDSEDINLLRMLAYSEMMIKKYKDAQFTINRIKIRSALELNDYLNLSIIYIHQTHYEEALNHINFVLGKSPKHAIALNNKGYVHIKQNEWVDAIKALEQSVEIDKNLAYAHNNLGLAKIRIGKREEGYKSIVHSLKLDDNNAHAFMNLGIYYQEVGDQKKHCNSLKMP